GVARQRARGSGPPRGGAAVAPCRDGTDHRGAGADGGHPRGARHPGGGRTARGLNQRERAEEAMRVIAGRARGMRLRAPRGTAVRPTADRVKESVVNILAAGIPGAAVLDLLAGSGARGIEALSRGADRAVFVDRARASLEAVRDNVSRAGLEQQAELVRADAL